MYSGGGRHGLGGNLMITIILAVLFIAALIFGIVEFSKVQDYKNNTDKKINQALTLRAAQLQSQAQTAFDAVNTYQYQGSPTYGSVTFRYPKTWSAYVDTTNTSEPINGYFHPSVVPGVNGKTAYALRVELTNNDYSQIVQQFDSDVSGGTVKSRAYVPPKMQGKANVVPGVYLTGQINDQDNSQNGAMVIIKVRDKTLQIYTDSTDYLSDFNNIILAGLTYSP